MSDERERDPWERLPDESPRANEAFRQYRDLGPQRTLAAMSHAGSTRVVRRWHHEHRWAERAQAWDIEAHRLDDAKRLEAIREMDDTHQRAARVLITAGLRALQDQPKLTPHQAARMIDLGTRLQRATLLGDHLEAPAGPAPVDTDEDLSPLERIARELAGTA